MRTEIIFNGNVRNNHIVSAIINEQSRVMLTEDSIFPTAQVNASLTALQSRIERVEIDENNNVRKIYVSEVQDNLLLG
tara:strand:- start:295 stop:528 length:234 start_codon:yes stop_codon:yes gene_type:complete